MLRLLVLSTIRRVLQVRLFEGNNGIFSCSYPSGNGHTLKRLYKLGDITDMPMKSREIAAVVMLAVTAGLAVVAVLLHYAFMAEYGDVNMSGLQRLI